MKKFKIFLLLSILLCFGFILSSEVYAGETNVTNLTGTKWLLNETFDYMPNGNYIWDSYGGSDEYDINFSSNLTNYTKLGFYDGDWLESSYSIWYYRYVDGRNYYDIGWQNEVWLDESYRTIEITGGTDVEDETLIAWLEANATQIIEPSEPKIFEVGDVLPAGNIKISWDFTGKPLSDGESFYIEFIEITQFDRPYDGYYIEIRIPSTLNPSASFFIGDTPGGTIITLTEDIPINDIGGSNYYEYIDGAIFWEVVSEEYANGYTDGSASADVNFFTGYVRGIEAYGYYDPITDRWLSVSEYLDLYGTDKMGQSDFYNNFDKYFIPAMIIVFGGAIVITVLKVFKGRE